MKWTFIQFYRLSFGLLDLFAIIYAFFAFREVINFFSYFTVLSNVLITGLFLYLVLHKPHKKEQHDFLRGAVFLYMSITGIVYWTILKHGSLGQDAWINLIMHGLMPIVVLVDWLIEPFKKRLAIKDSLLWLLFPILFVCYSLIRGAFIHWYPYFFLNPEKVHGYLNVFEYVIGITVGSWILGMVIVFLSNARLKNK